MSARFPHGNGPVLTYVPPGDHRAEYPCGRCPWPSSPHQGMIHWTESLLKVLIASFQRVAFTVMSTRPVPCGNSSQGAPDSHSVIVPRPRHPPLQRGPRTRWSPNRKYLVASLLPSQVGPHPIPRTITFHPQACLHPSPRQMNVLVLPPSLAPDVVSSINHVQALHCNLHRA